LFLLFAFLILLWNNLFSNNIWFKWLLIQINKFLWRVLCIEIVIPK
jgi:hypothetical protein